MVAVLTLLLAGDLVRYALTVPVWVGIVFVATAWGVAVLWTNRVSWRHLPLALLATLGWWLITPLWSPYAANSALMLVPAVFTVILGAALVTAVPLDEFIRRGALTLRLVLVGSILFEIAVGIYGRPVYPVGIVATPTTPIEVAWSRAVLFVPGARIQGLVGNANILGMLSLILLIVAVWRITASREWRTMSSLDVIVALFLIYRTMSATVTVAALGVGIVVVLAAFARRHGIQWRVAFWASIAAMVGAAVVAILKWSTVAGFLGKSPDMTHRFDIWKAVLGRIADQPVVGHGFVGWWPTWDPWFAIHTIDGVPMMEAHNAWLDLTMQTGLIGAALFAIALGTILYSLWRAFCESPRSVAAVPFLILDALAVQSLTESRILIEWGLASVVAFGIVAERLRAGFTSRP